MQAILAVYEKGVFTPQQRPELAEHQKVQLIVIHPAPTDRPRRVLFSRKKQALLSKLQALVAGGIFDLALLPEDLAREYLERPVSLEQVRASLASVPGEYVDRLLDAEREEN